MALIRLYSDMQRYNPHRQPDWRYQRVLRMVDRYPTPGRCTGRDDEWIRGMRNYILRWRASSEHERENLWYDNPALHYAFNIYEQMHGDEDPETAFMVESRILSNQPYAEIAEELGTIPEAIEWYEAIFFNVRDYLRCHDWIVRQVLTPAMMRGRRFRPSRGKSDDDDWAPPIVEPFYDWTIKFYAYFGGPLALEFMLTGFRRDINVTTREGLSQYLDQQWASQIRRRSAQAAGVFKVNNFNITELFALHARIMEIERGADSDEQKQSAIDKHISALLKGMPWAAGAAGRESIANTPLEALDDAAAELRDDELLLVSAGEKPKSIEEVPMMQLPPPRKKRKEGEKDGDANSELK